MIAGISMYQPSNAGVHNPQHHTMPSELVGYQPVVDMDASTGSDGTNATTAARYDAIQQQMMHQQYMQQQLQHQHQLHNSHHPSHPSPHHLYGTSSNASVNAATGTTGTTPTTPLASHLYNAVSSQPLGMATSSSSANTHANMMELQQQFQQFRLPAAAAAGADDPSSESNLKPHELSAVGNSGPPMHDDSETNDTHLLEHAEEDGEEEPVKLFVGQIPKAMNEEDIFPTFDSFGPLKDVSVIRDKHSGLHRGCAFVTYWSAVDAERARLSLHDVYTFPGAKRPAQVKPAEPSAVPESKLFIGMLSRESDEQTVHDLFVQFGEILEVYMIRNPDGSSKCAAFLRFATRESAVAAIEQLNGIEVMDGVQRPLIVKFADNKMQRQQRHIRNVRRHELMTMVGPPGGYPYAPPGANMAMGLHHPAAVAAGAPYAMPTPQVYGAAAYGTPGAPAPHHNPYLYPSPYGQVAPYAYQHQAAAAAQAAQVRSERSNPRPREGPAGANLFVYHLPHDLTDADLATAFNPFGNVISAKVYVDKFTGESKGFGFVSYDSVLAAEQAIEQMNGFQIGNKRLKVQHKRVHGGGGGSISSPPLDAQSPPSDASATGLPGPAAG